MTFASLATVLVFLLRRMICTAPIVHRGDTLAQQ